MQVKHKQTQEKYAKIEVEVTKNNAGGRHRLNKLLRALQIYQSPNKSQCSP